MYTKCQTLIISSPQADLARFDAHAPRTFQPTLSELSRWGKRHSPRLLVVRSWREGGAAQQEVRGRSWGIGPSPHFLRRSTGVEGGETVILG